MLVYLDRKKQSYFREYSPSVHSVVIKTLGLFKKHPSTQKLIPIRACLITQHVGFSIAFFDGAAQLDNKLCGAGGVIKTPDSTVYRWHFNNGEGTNTKAELLGIWATLTLANHLALPKLQALGDSKVIIEWLNNRGRLQASAIEGWKHRTKELIKKISRN
jgi:hypothetical protein